MKSVELKITALIEDGEGDCLCMACKRSFGIIRTSQIAEGAGNNYCPHCGAKVVHVHELGNGDHVDDAIKEDA